MNNFCPSDFTLLVQEKGKCVNDCKNEDIYKYKYDNKCLQECPNTTITDNINYYCKDKNANISLLTETDHIFFNGTDYDNKLLVNNYINNFIDRDNHISFYKANNNVLAVYRKTELISSLSIDIPKFNYENCYTKVKNILNITEDLIIVLQYEKNNNGNNKFISHTVYDPRNGEKISYEEMCKDEPVVVEENIENKIPDLDSFVELTNQGIDLFNPDSAFYTDICYHYKSPIDGKDIPLKERFKLFFPNASLCENGCSIKGINTTTNASICECSLNKLINNEFLEDNILLGGAMGELKTLIEDTNIEVLKCYGDITNGELIAKNYGSFIILGLIISQIILAVIYFIAYISSMSRYLFNLIENILSYLSKKENNTQNSFKK